MLGKKYNMGVKKDDATLNLDKTYFRIHVTKEAHQDFFYVLALYRILG